MGRIAKKDYIKGFFCIRKGNEKGKYDLVYRVSLDGNPYGNGLNEEVIYEHNIDLNEELKSAIKKHKITRAIWITYDSYVMPKNILNGRELIIIV